MITLGLWPIAGITTVGVTDADAAATIAAAIDAGITSFDTAFSYGYDGESDRHLGRAIGSQRDRFTVMGKVGQRWTADRKRVVDGSPDQLIADAELSLSRIGIDAFDVLYLHSPDPGVPIQRSAEAMERLRARGVCKQVGVCNLDAGQLDQFCEAAKCDAVQCPLNLLQRDSLTEFIPRSQFHGASVHVFWTLMKGLLAGKIGRDHQFAEGDSRPSYAIFQGESRERAHRIVDELAKLGRQIDRTVAQLAIGWVLAQNGVNSALVGARRPDQIQELATANRLESGILAKIDALVAGA
jgi:aryl-alcohol dehydrogenase-like predicted oxidoreductase